MRGYNKLIAIIALLALGSVAIVGCGGWPTGSGTSKPAAEKVESPFAVGDKVAAVWNDGSKYLAEVTKIDGDDVTVKYVDDSSSKTIAAKDVQPITVKKWNVGDKVKAVWSSGRFYSGTVSEAKDPTYKIKWDDGSDPSEVTADKIIAPQ